MCSNGNNLDFNQDELEPIVQHEVNVEDQLNLANALANSSFSKHKPDLFKTICQQAAKKDKHADWRYILKCCGWSINHIYDGGYCMTAEILALAQKFCPQLKTINISLSGDNLQYVQLYLPQWKMLEEIELRGPANIERLLLSLKDLPHLRKLSLWDFYIQIPEFRELNCLTQLKHLELNVIMSGFPWRIPDLLKNLVSLSLYSIADKQTLGQLAEYCTKLENLYLYDDKDKVPWTIDYFYNLKCLEIHDQRSCAVLLLKSLDQRYNNQLQKLIIPGKCIYQQEAMRISNLKALKTLSCVLPDVRRCLVFLVRLHLEQLSLYNCRNLTNSNLLFILYKCKTLRSLEVTLCPMITANFITDALQILFLNGVKPDNPFELVLSGSGLSTDVNDEMALHSHSNLLRLTVN